MPEYKLSPNVLLKHLDNRNLQVYKAYAERGEVERKELERLLGYMLPIWFSNIESSAEQFDMVFQFNQHVNCGWFDLRIHPELQAKLLAAIGPGVPVRHQFHKRATGTGPAPNLTALLQQRYRDIRPEEVVLWCSVNSEAGLLEMCEDYGVQPKDRDVIITEYRDKVR